MKTSQGFSQAELMVVLVILAILLSLAVPSLQNQVHESRRVAALNQMIGAANHARSSAVFSRKTMSICAGDNGCDGNKLWRGQFLIFVDKNHNGRLDADERIERLYALPDGFTWYWSSFRKLTYISFENNGTTRASNGTMTLCHEGKPLNQIVISLSGRVRHKIADADATCG
ncbi:GspH/FimT family pseudopilin [Aquipseudomonas alcaligenes]|uniref:GspH/FimT family pseudopilin n=1 Tax=Aquipseudomonas alcaligenes TaxID=43263 RepID=UPI00242C9321|nr:GspH/FimT family pseudopilin [Pseudomonas alcaligenes]